MQPIPHPAICPYLGTQEDPETSFSFPSAQNCCWRHAPPRRVRHDYQSTTCLTAEYNRCPLLPGQPVPPSPAAVPAQPSPESPSTSTAPETGFPSAPPLLKKIRENPPNPRHPRSNPPAPVSEAALPLSSKKSAKIRQIRVIRGLIPPLPRDVLGRRSTSLLPLATGLLAFLLTLALLALLALKY